MTRPPVVLIGGWGQTHAPLLEGLPEGLGKRFTVDLDDHQVGPEDTLEDLADRLARRMPAGALWVGWSLGGQVAMAAAQRASRPVLGVVTVASSPRFVAWDTDFPGLMPHHYQRFVQALKRDPLMCWRDFLKLQVVGDVCASEARALLRPHLRNEPGISVSVLDRTLNWLGTQDQRLLWTSSGFPRLHLFGERDRIVAPDTVQALESGSVDGISGLSHWPHGPHARTIRLRINEFLTNLEVAHESGAEFA